MPTLKAADAVIAVNRRTGCLHSLRVGKAAVEMAGHAPAGFLEVADLHDGETYHPLRDKFTISGWKQTSAGGKKTLSFVQKYKGAAFRIQQSFVETAAGIRWEASLRLLPGEKKSRSVRVTWVLPIPWGWKFWSPQDTSVQDSDGVTPQRYVYGHISFRPYGTMIPLVAAWPGPGRRGRSPRKRGARAGLVAFSPPEIQKPFISFDLHTQHAPSPVRGIDHAFEDLSQLRITHHLVGLRPPGKGSAAGKELRLAVCLAGTKPDWRCSLGHYVKSYPELFEPIPATRKVEGMYGITNPTRLARGHLARMKKAGVTFVEVHGHFPEYSVYMSREALKDPKLTWRCRPHPGKRLSLAGNRQCIRRLKAAGIAPFMYWYNCHAKPDTIRRLWRREPMRDERGRVMLKWHEEPALHGAPESPYGRHLMEQMDLMLEAYPGMAGLFVDNYAIEMIDFAHDDGVTMVHDRPAYDLNRNHQLLGPPCFQKAHEADKVIMVNKISTIESLRGADMVLAETRGVASLRKHALACVYRPLFPLGMELPPGPHGLERGLQHLLLLGCIPDDRLYRQGPQTMRAYRPLTDAMIGKRWVLEFDPLEVSRRVAGKPVEVPEGVRAEVFRIDRHAPHGGSVVVSVVDLNRSWKEKEFTKGLLVKVRLPEAARLKKATWLAVEGSGRRRGTCKMRRSGKEITIQLPPLGAAGILRLGAVNSFL